ncbi:AAA family ATPase, partial [Neisseria gonorrhoeae]
MSAPVILSAAATKGGVGKTTLIANVSAVLADIGLRVLMI